MGTTRDNAATCARCTCAARGNGLCREHARKRRVMIRHSAERVDARASAVYVIETAPVAKTG